MEQHSATATATATAKTTILDIPTDCWNLILSKLRTPRHTHISSHHAHIYPLTLTCKHILSITNTHPCHLTLYPLLPRQLTPLTTLLPPLLRRFSACLQTLSIHHSSSSSVDAALSYVVSSNATAHLRALHLKSINALPQDGLCHLGSSLNNVKVLTLLNISGLRDQQLLVVCRVLPLLEEIDVSYNNLSDEGISGLAQHLKCLRKINLTQNVLITDKSLIALSDCCSDLSDVKVHGCRHLTQNGIGYVMRHSTKLTGISMNRDIQLTLENSDSLFSIGNSIGFCRNLSKLEFYHMKLEDKLLRSITEAALPLTQFVMSNCSNSTRASLRGLSTLISAYPKIQKLDISAETWLTDEVMKGLVYYLSNLVVIDIGNCSGFSTSTFQMLVTNCPVLEEMDAMNTLLGLGELDEPLVKVNNIKCLKISSNFLLKDELLEKIGIMCPNLEDVDVSFCENLTSKGIGKLVNGCRELKHLVIQEWMQPLLFGMDFEGTSLNLEVLDLSEGKFGDECISEIAKTCPKLLYVDLGNCKEVTAKSVKELVESCKNLRVLDLYKCYKVIPKVTKKNYNEGPKSLACIVSGRPSLRTSSFPINYGTY